MLESERNSLLLKTLSTEVYYQDDILDDIYTLPTEQFKNKLFHFLNDLVVDTSDDKWLLGYTNKYGHITCGKLCFDDIRYTAKTHGSSDEAMRHLNYLEKAFTKKLDTLDTRSVPSSISLELIKVLRRWISNLNSPKTASIISNKLDMLEDLESM